MELLEGLNLCIDLINDKTGVINDPLGKPTVPAVKICFVLVDFENWMDVRTTCLNIVITTGRDCGQPRGSKM